jgi:beta-glucanase (GH16 family)
MKATGNRKTGTMFKSILAPIGAALMALAGTACAGPDFPQAVDALPAEQSDIDLSNYKITYEENFNRLDVSGRRCDSEWIAHTPWNGDFGSAAFVDPSRGFPFKTKKGLLRIEARKDPSHGWLSGLLSGYNTCGEGFTQQYGYFEIRTMLPAGDGFWPAFWLIGVNRENYTAEIDIFEHHGVRPDQFASTIHVYPRTEGVAEVNRSNTYKVPQNALVSGFNTYGVSVEEDDMVFYFNRKEIWRIETGEEFKQPLFILLNLAMDARETTDLTPTPAHMYVDYVRVYAKKDGAEE